MCVQALVLTSTFVLADRVGGDLNKCPIDVVLSGSVRVYRVQRPFLGDHRAGLYCRMRARPALFADISLTNETSCYGHHLVRTFGA